MNPAEFLDLVHRYVLIISKPEEHDKINASLTGPLNKGGAAQVDEQAGFIPPSWWKGDEYASRSGMLAAATLRR